MKVLMLSQFYPPVIGGEERHVASLSQSLLARGHQVSVATIATPGTAPGPGVEEGVRVHRIRTTAQRLPMLHSDGGRPHASPLPDPELSAGLLRAVRAESPDVIHAHNWIVNSLLPLRPWLAAPVVLTLHDYSHGCAVKRLMRRGAPCAGPGPVRCIRCSSRHYGAVSGTVTALATRPAAALKERALDAVIAVSSAVVEGNGLASSRLPVHVVPNSIPDQLWEASEGPPTGQPLDPRLPAEPFLLFAGDLSRDKGIHVLLEAYGRLARRPPLVLIGRRTTDTPEQLPAGVRVLDGCPHPVVMDAFRRCLAAVAPSVWPEPFGLVVLEALTAGSPLVAAASGGIKDIVVDRESGLLVRPGDAGELHAALRRLLEEPALRRRLSAGGRLRSRLFTAGQVLPRLEEIYHSALAARRQPSGSASGMAWTAER